MALTLANDENESRGLLTLTDYEAHLLFESAGDPYRGDKIVIFLNI